MKKNIITEKKLYDIIDYLEKHHIIESIHKAQRFHDDPPSFLYWAKLCKPQEKTSGTKNHTLNSSALSFFSPEDAMIKCLSEAIERFSLLCYQNSDIQRESYQNLKENAFNPMEFLHDEKVKKKKFGWIKGYNFTANNSCLIPAQLVFLNYRRNLDNAILPIQPIGSGAAAELSHERVLIKAIYELVERDSFMNFYLLKLRAQQVSLSTFVNRAIEQLVAMSRKYNIDLQVYFISTDLKIPCFLTILFDKTGRGPAVSLGIKASFDIEEAIIGSIEEAFMTRQGMREMSYEIKYFNLPISKNHIIQRGLYWYNTTMIKKLSFLSSNSKTFSATVSHSFNNEKQELEHLKNLLRNKGYNIFYVDVTLDIFKKMGYFIYKVIIPNLQPLYLDEEYKQYVNRKRLKTVASFFSKKHVVINTLPHPFL